MFGGEPERTGHEEESGRPSNDKKPPDHQEQIQAIAALFGPSRPKDVVTGTANGIAMVVAGAGAGVGALFALPAIGAAQGGAVRAEGARDSRLEQGAQIKYIMLTITG
jgi:hypothetical protein